MYIEMTDLKFSLTNPCHKKILQSLSFSRNKKLSGLVSSNDQSIQALVD